MAHNPQVSCAESARFWAFPLYGTLPSSSQATASSEASHFQTRAHNKTKRPDVLMRLLTQWSAPQRFRSAKASLRRGPPRSKRFVGIMTVSV